MIETCVDVEEWKQGQHHMEKQALDPNDFPVAVDDRTLVTQQHEPIADARSSSLARDIAMRLNQNAARTAEERWAL